MQYTEIVNVCKPSASFFTVLKLQKTQKDLNETQYQEQVYETVVTVPFYEENSITASNTCMEGKKEN
jgi:hypothetical protein